MARSGVLVAVLWLSLLAVALTAAPFAAEAITCAEVASELRPCIPYATGRGPISAPCCSGVRVLNSASPTPADRRTTCACIKSTASGVPGVNGTVLSGIPGKCGVSVPNTVSPSTDCSKVK